VNRILRYLLPLVPVAVLLAAAPAAPGAEPAYVGTNNCKKCHVKEWKSWSETKMAKTFEVLKPGVSAEAKTAAGLDANKDYTKDPTCVACHTTGFGKPGGFVDIATTPDRAGVGCEMCHGPGGTYTQEGYMTLKNKEYKKAELVKVGMVGEVSAAQCINCHNTDSPFVDEKYLFDFAKKKTAGTHELFPLKYQH
jgi:hypothetical protein